MHVITLTKCGSVIMYTLVLGPFLMQVHVLCVGIICRWWPQMLAWHWCSMLFGLGSYWMTPPWRRCWSFCASIQPTAPQVCMCVSVLSVCMSMCLCRHCAWPVPAHCLCLWLAIWLSHTRFALRAPLSFPMTTEQHCVSLYKTSACLPASYNGHSVRIQARSSCMAV